MEPRVCHQPHPQDAPQLVVECPVCAKGGTFTVFAQDHRLGPGSDEVYVGHRRCPNTNCNAHLFVAWKDGEIVFCDPPQGSSWDRTRVPGPIVSVFNEALTCRAHRCYRAAGMMIRRTLEELCDLKGAKGGNLAERIRALQEFVTLPKPLLQAIDELRLLGNDAAHVVAKDYEEIGSAEIEVAAELTCEILRALYQHEGLLAKLKGLKKSEE